MSKQFKLTIPLLHEKLTKEMVSPEAGFVDAFTQDINKPALDNHILLMYDFEKERTKEMTKRMCKFALEVKIKPFLHKIDGHWYQIYALPIQNSDAYLYKTLKYKIFSSKSVLRLIDFWGTSDKEINDFILNPASITPEFKESYIKEEDYVED